jgi:hypothetical protein
MVEPVWCEFAACYLSAPISPEHASLYETTVIDVLKIVRERIIVATQEWPQNKDFAGLLLALANEAGSVRKYFAYLLGHAAGLDKTPEEIAPRAWAYTNARLALSMDRET